VTRLRAVGPAAGASRPPAVNALSTSAGVAPYCLLGNRAVGQLLTDGRVLDPGVRASLEGAVRRGLRVGPDPHRPGRVRAHRRVPGQGADRRRGRRPARLRARHRVGSLVDRARVRPRRAETAGRRFDGRRAGAGVRRRGRRTGLRRPSDQGDPGAGGQPRAGVPPGRGGRGQGLPELGRPDHPESRGHGEWRAGRPAARVPGGGHAGVRHRRAQGPGAVGAGAQGPGGHTGARAEAPRRDREAGRRGTAGLGRRAGSAPGGFGPGPPPARPVTPEPAPATPAAAQPAPPEPATAEPAPPKPATPEPPEPVPAQAQAPEPTPAPADGRRSRRGAASAAASPSRRSPNRRSRSRWAGP
jgi:hypothetical protein